MKDKKPPNYKEKEMPKRCELCGYYNPYDANRGNCELHDEYPVKYYGVCDAFE